MLRGGTVVDAELERWTEGAGVRLVDGNARQRVAVIDEAGVDLRHIARDMDAFQLVALAAIADIMPLKDENRIFIRNGLDSIKKDGPRQGLAELFCQLKINTEALTSIDISWTVTPALNAAGRLGQADVALKLLISEKESENKKLNNKKVMSLNEEDLDELLKDYSPMEIEKKI